MNCLELGINLIDLWQESDESRDDICNCFETIATTATYPSEVFKELLYKALRDKKARISKNIFDIIYSMIKCYVLAYDNISLDDTFTPMMETEETATA